ncbi:MAG: hypothetical protein QN122_13550 [Armatimonadota bacterium]|nr:hypothetical protein [Armatimonadota bacterium]
MPIRRDPLIEPPPPPAPGSFGRKLIDGVVYAADAAARAIGARLWNTIADRLERFERWLLEQVDQSVEILLAKLDAVAPEEEPRSIIRHLMDAPPAILAALAGLVVLFFQVLGSITKSVGDTLLKRFIARINFASNRAVPTYRMATEDALMAYARGAIPYEMVIEDALDLGVSRERAEALIARSWRWLTIPQIEELYYRGITTAEETMELLRGFGLSPQDAERMFKSFERLVSLSDLTRFAAREVFRPDLLPRLLEDLPSEEYFEEAAKLGLNRRRASWYWAAHWDLPAVTQMFQMFQRIRRDRNGVRAVTEEDVRELLRLQDILPYYHDWLMQIAYRPPNRLDTWRLAISHRITRQEAVEWFRDYGYAPELAERLADLATDEKRTRVRDLTQQTIIALYKRRALTREQARDELQELGFQPEDAELLLLGADLELQTQRAEARTSIIRKRWLFGLITDAQASDALAALGKGVEEIGELLELWRSERAERAEVPPVTTIETWYKRRIISGPEAREELRRRGYDDRYVDWWLLEWDQEIQEAEEARSREELERRQRQLKVPTRADLQAWVKAGLITVEQFAQRLRQQGYSEEDIRLYAAAVGLAPPETPAYRTEAGRIQVRSLRLLYHTDAITTEEYLRQLMALGMSRELAEATVTYETLVREVR